MFDRDLNTAFILLGILCAVVGWAAIEFVLWLLSHISLSWQW
ncbi:MULTISPECIES: hypothetical protein [Brenneria]|nr:MULTISPECIES: hypothetical protein [Brenneria]EHD21793.1 hypothetical protein BrE312_2413 [Brenneria sp. EniD312]